VLRTDSLTGRGRLGIRGLSLETHTSWGTVVGCMGRIAGTGGVSQTRWRGLRLSVRETMKLEKKLCEDEATTATSLFRVTLPHQDFTFSITAFLRQLPEIGSLCDAMLDANLLTVCRFRDS
jgi:hypothetical protein